MTLYLLKYNNYYNRIVKRHNTINEYNNGEDVLAILPGIINFNPNNDINTTQVINYDGEMPDYLIAVNDEDIIDSRWYVISHNRLRGNQYSLSIYRDIIADYYDEVINKPMFIEKATASIGDVAIFNNENMGFNQIKTTETLLKDKSRCAWIVGYVDPKYEGGQITIPVSQTTVAAEYTSLDQYPYYSYNASNPIYLSDNIQHIVFRYNFYNKGITGGSYVVSFGMTGANDTPHTHIQENAVNSNFWHKDEDLETGYRVPYGVLGSGSNAMSRAAKKIFEKLKGINWTRYTYVYSDLVNTIKSTSLSTIYAENGKVIKVGNLYYKVNVNSANYEAYLLGNIPNGTTLANEMYNIISDNSDIDLNTYTDPRYQYEVSIIPYYFTFEQINIDSYNITMPSPANRAHLEDAPYDMFAIPYGNLYYGSLNGNYYLTMEIGMRLASEIQKSLGSGETSKLYDIQLLPYAPLPDTMFDDTESNYAPVLLSARDGLIYTPLQKDSNIVSCLIWLNKSHLTKYINTSITVPSNNIEFKVQNECDMYRLSSPNYNSGFEFSATKNNGVLRFRADIAYKPISPYIRVAPEFNNLYGNIKDDARGLICGGDFSLPQTNDKWLEFQRTNKNFQDIFDRQIETMEFNNNIARIQDVANMVSGTLSGTTSGAMTGFMASGGNPYAAAAGAVGGGAFSAIGGIVDMNLNRKLRNEALDFTKDNFGYQLGNIKALPTGLTKVSALNPNNKIFPVLEYYTATAIEKQALRNKIKYNGMTIMRIGTIEEFLQDGISYIKGQLIRNENIESDYSFLSALADELNKGVFI